jgi:RHS repeat-associated protein
MADIKLIATDRLQSPVAYSDGADIANSAFTPYGFTVVSDKSPVTGFTGQLCERGQGFYLLGNGRRMFNPALGIFYSPDVEHSPFGPAGINYYMYCYGNPVRYHDRSGRLGEDDIARLPSWEISTDDAVMIASIAANTVGALSPLIVIANSIRVGALPSASTAFASLAGSVSGLVGLYMDVKFLLGGNQGDRMMRLAPPVAVAVASLIGMGVAMRKDNISSQNKKVDAATSIGASESVSLTTLAGQEYEAQSARKRSTNDLRGVGPNISPKDRPATPAGPGRDIPAAGRWGSKFSFSFVKR